MKKNKLFIVAAAAMILGAFALVGCEKPAETGTTTTGTTGTTTTTTDDHTSSPATPDATGTEHKEGDGH